MSNVRSIAFVVAVPVLAVCLLLFIRGLSKPDPSASLTGKLEKIVGDWTVNKVPVNSRVVNLVIGNADAGEDVLSLPEAPAAPSILDKLKGLFLGNAARAVERPSPFTQAFAKDKSAVTWTFDGFSKAQESAVIEELAKNIVKLHDSEAVLNIVAQGEVGAAVLKSVKSLEGQLRGGVQVGANSVMLLGMDTRRLKAYDPEYFSLVKRPSNVGEWANVTAPGMRLEDGTVELFSARYDGKELPGRFLTGLLPPEGRLSSSGLPIKIDALAMAIIGVFDRQGGLEQWVTVQEQQEEQRLAQQRREAELEEARRMAEEEARRRAEEEAKRRAEEEAQRRAAEEAARRKAAEAAQRRAEGKWPIEGHTARVAWASIPGGTFMMGSEAGSNEKPRHRVSVRGFQLAKTEVTNAQYRGCVQAGACSPPGDQRDGKNLYGDDQPVVNVDWNQAKAFSEWAGGRLPSEAEWEYAARSAGRDWEYPWGNEQATCSRAVISDGGDGCGKKSTWPVCSKPAGNTAQGLCDMAGNVWEWTQDGYHDSYNGAPSDGRAWESPTGSHRVDRGGSWRLGAARARAAYRYDGGPGHRDDFLGFAPCPLRSTVVGRLALGPLDTWQVAQGARPGAREADPGPLPAQAARHE